MSTRNLIRFLAYLNIRILTIFHPNTIKTWRRNVTRNIHFGKHYADGLCSAAFPDTIDWICILFRIQFYYGNCAEYSPNCSLAAATSPISMWEFIIFLQTFDTQRNTLCIFMRAEHGRQQINGSHVSHSKSVWVRSANKRQEKFRARRGNTPLPNIWGLQDEFK